MDKHYQNNVTRHLIVGLLSLILLAIAVESSQSAPSTGQPPIKAGDHAPAHREQLGKIASPAAQPVGSPTQATTTAPATAAAAAPRPVRHSHDKPESILDLSYLLHDGTLHWPKNAGFQYKVEVEADKKSQNGDSYYVKSDGFTMAVHTGTHLDSPRHFSKTGWTVEQIPLERLINVPLTVIDLSEKVKANRSYNFVKQDFISAQNNEPLVQAKSVVLIYTGISSFYDQGEKAYFGTDSKNISEMKIPGFSKEAAQYLVERQIFGVGLDAPSADSSDRHGSNEQYDPQAHVVFNSNNIYILENVSNKLKELLRSPAPRLTIAPLPIVNGSGSPVRLVATFGAHDECSSSPAANAAHSLALYSSPVLTISLLITLVTYFMALHGQTASM